MGVVELKALDVLAERLHPRHQVRLRIHRSQLPRERGWVRLRSEIPREPPPALLARVSPGRHGSRPRQRSPEPRPPSSRTRPAAAKLELTSRRTRLVPTFEPR